MFSPGGGECQQKFLFTDTNSLLKSHLISITDFGLETKQFCIHFGYNSKGYMMSCARCHSVVAEIPMSDVSHGMQSAHTMNIAQHAVIREWIWILLRMILRLLTAWLKKVGFIVAGLCVTACPDKWSSALVEALKGGSYNQGVVFKIASRDSCGFPEILEFAVFGKEVVSKTSSFGSMVLVVSSVFKTTLFQHSDNFG